MNGMTVIVKTISRLVLGFIVVFGASIVLYGHIAPGGGFAGGVILAAGFVLLILSFGTSKAEGSLGSRILHVWDSFGVLSLFEFICIGLFGGFMLKNYLPEGEPMRLLSAGTILWSNLIVGIKVGVFLFAIFLAYAFFNFDDTTKERR